MAASSSDDGEITGINVTPLVDVTLVLLIIFMVTAKLVYTQALPLDLPKASSGAPTSSPLVLSLDAAGALTVNGSAVQNDDALRMLARAAVDRDPHLRVLLSASARASHGAVVHVMDILRDVGIDQLAFAAEPMP
jgi:biopolymer transport protein ExbD